MPDTNSADVWLIYYALLQMRVKLERIVNFNVWLIRIRIRTMEDINAKRNARRKRILENSEKRLSKITGRDENNESEGK